MNFGRAFGFVFQDKDWLRKIIIPALVGLIPIIGQFVVLGWGLSVTRRVMAHDPEPLPDLDDGNMALGLQVFVIGLVYALPIILLLLFLVFTMFPIFSLDTLDWMESASVLDAVLLIFGLIRGCGSLFIVVYGVILVVMLPAAYANFLAKGSLRAGLNFGEVFRLVRAAPGAYLLVLVGSIVAGLIATLGASLLMLVGLFIVDLIATLGEYLFVQVGPFVRGLIETLGAILCFVAGLLPYVYGMAAIGHLYGQAYNQALKKLGMSTAA